MMQDTGDAQGTGPGGSGSVLKASRVFDGESGSITAARHFATGFVTQLRDSHGIAVARNLVGAVQLVVSELITNACKYAPGPALLDLEFADQALKITVTDSSPGLPIAREAEPGRVGQHGLEIVMALCDGFDVQRRPPGKRISVRLPLPASA
ncbi:ATP-binding protein [Streptomyces sp. NPDC008141]|uniref:ATP-binding protein n=1 Tax=Streptomyces sp. NPDC008141 TaxID=3364815 RepID=UPI0036E2B9FE